MARERSAVAVGGLDPSGGAGVLADVAAFRVAGIWGAAVCACSTVQNTRSLQAVEVTSATLVAKQLEALWIDLRVGAIKTGAMGSRANAEVVGDRVDRGKGALLVVDPVMAPTSGEASLCGSGAEDLRPLIERAHLLTPNVPEAERLLASPIDSLADMRDAAVDLRRMGPRAVLLKGGHLDTTAAWSIDVLATRHGVISLRSRRLARLSVHGTGCVLASLIAGRLVREKSRGSARDMEAAVRWASSRFRRYLRQPLRVGAGSDVLPLGVCR